MDALSETLRVVQLVGAIFINARFTAPWCYRSPSAAAAAPILEPGAERIVIFHLVTEGECYVEMENALPVKLIAGDVVVFPAGDTHCMTSQPGLPPAKGCAVGCGSRAAATATDLRRRGARRHGWCAAIWRATPRLARMLLAGLPPLVKVNVRGSNAGVWLEASVRYALAEARSPRPGGAGVLSKLAEVLFIEVLRLYMNEQHEGGTGWLAGGSRPRRGYCVGIPAQTARPQLDPRRARPRGGSFEVGSRGSFPATRRKLPDAISDAMAHAAGVQSPEPQQCVARYNRGSGWATKQIPPSAARSGASLAHRLPPGDAPGPLSKPIAVSPRLQGTIAHRQPETGP